MIEKLQKKLNDRYFKTLEGLNSNTKQALTEGEKYTLPRLHLKEVDGEFEYKNEWVTVEPETKEMKIRLDMVDLETAINDEPYFNHYFDNLLKVSLPKYKDLVGPSDKVRWGDYYIKMDLKESNASKGYDSAILTLSSKLVSDV